MAEYLEHEKVLDDNNIITVQTREYGSIEVIPVDTITDIELADVQPIDRWISVNDKLPEQDEEVLVFTKDKDIMTMIYKVIPFRWYKPKFGGFDKDYVTHWKPRPEPPKDGDTK